MPILVLAVVAAVGWLVWYVGKKSVACGILLAILVAFGLIGLIILTSQVTFHIEGSGIVK